MQRTQFTFYISIHAPRVGSDCAHVGAMKSEREFQSTLPVWGATPPNISDRRKTHISIHAPRVGSDARQPGIGLIRSDFNPRSPCGERQSWNAGGTATMAFQSTLPVWGATGLAINDLFGSAISIHAPRVGSDAEGRKPLYLRYHFNPRSPCGERQKIANGEKTLELFQSTLPVWGATVVMLSFSVLTFLFQSTLPVWGATNDSRDGNIRLLFQSTLPVWGATPYPPGCRRSEKFQSTLPVWGATDGLPGLAGYRLISIHAPRVGSDSQHH